MDLRTNLIMIREGETWAEQTSAIQSYRVDGARVHVTYSSSGRTYHYNEDRVAFDSNPQTTATTDAFAVFVDDKRWRTVTAVVSFTTSYGAWKRLYYSTNTSDDQHTLRRANQVVVLANAASDPSLANVLGYCRRVAALLRQDDPIHRALLDIRFVHPDSALARIFGGSGFDPDPSPPTAIFPFSSNLSQRRAVEMALASPVSIIQGPPGTGKTQAIVNIVASIVAEGSLRVGVVSLGNSAVLNVLERLTADRWAFVAALLGNEPNRKAFVSRMTSRAEEVEAFRETKQDTAPPSTEQLLEITRHYDVAQQAQCDIAKLREERSAFELERAHFDRLIDQNSLTHLTSSPIFRKSADRIVELLAEATVDSLVGTRASLTTRFRRFLKYGRTGDLDFEDVTVIHRLQQAYYDRRIIELGREISRLERSLDQLTALQCDHETTSRHILDASLHHRYSADTLPEYRDKPWLDKRFADDFPVVLSTCHSLSSSLRPPELVDLLIVDEASQVDLLAGFVALARARHVVIVGDSQQLPHIAEKVDPGPGPNPFVDYIKHNLLSSVSGMLGGRVPVTQLREHYRCDPVIIGFCNAKFYDGQLIPFTTPTRGRRSMSVWRTVRGLGPRDPTSGGTFNQREVDVVQREVLELRPDLDADSIGIATPYRAQVAKLTEHLANRGDIDTVHRYQGRQRRVMVLSTVLDGRRRYARSRHFVDDPNLINVAVSRAQEEFILVTHPDLGDVTQNIRDLIEYIDYQNMGEGIRDSKIVSVFDLLYQEYSDCLNSLAGRIIRVSRFDSENIIWTLLHDILGEPALAQLKVVREVVMSNIVAPSVAMSEEERRYVRNGARVDFVIYNGVTNVPVLGIEVDGFTFHENNPRQLVKDALKNSICDRVGLPLLRLPTTGSEEEALIRRRLAEVWPVVREPSRD